MAATIARKLALGLADCKRSVRLQTGPGAGAFLSGMSLGLSYALHRRPVSLNRYPPGQGRPPRGLTFGQRDPRWGTEVSGSAEHPGHPSQRFK
jgi:hypothetical protein